MIKKILKRTILTIIMVFGITNSIYAAQILTDWTNASSSSANGVLGSVTVTFSASSNTILPPMVFEDFSGFSNPSIYDPAIATTEAIGFLGERGTTGYDYTIEFNSPVENPVIYIASLASILTFDPGVSLTKISGQDAFTVIGNTVSGVLDSSEAPPNNDANGIFQLNGVFTDVGFNALWDFPSGNPNDGIALQIGIVPLPAAVWLFGSALIAIIGLRKRTGEVGPRQRIDCD